MTKKGKLLRTELLVPHPQCTKCLFSSTSQFPVPTARCWATRARRWAINMIWSEEERKKVLCRPGGGNEGSALRIQSFLFSQLLFSSPSEGGNTASGKWARTITGIWISHKLGWMLCLLFCVKMSHAHNHISIRIIHCPNSQQQSCFQRGVAGRGSLSITEMCFFTSMSLSCWAVSQQRSLLVPGHSGKQKCLSLNAGVQPADGLRVVSGGKKFTYLWSSPY